MQNLIWSHNFTDLDRKHAKFKHTTFNKILGVFSFTLVKLNLDDIRNIFGVELLNLTIITLKRCQFWNKFPTILELISILFYELLLCLLQQENSLSHSLHSYGFIKIFSDLLLQENDFSHFLRLVVFFSLLQILPQALCQDKS